MIKVRHLAKQYETYERGSTFAEAVRSFFYRKRIVVDAVRDISFDVEPGELLGFLGPNGAGKSTTLKMLTGILYPTSGEAQVFGYTPWLQRKAYVAHIGAVFGQKSQLIWDIPPIDSFAMNRAIYGIPVREYEQRLDKMVSLLNVSALVRKPVRQLSLGERMKCEFIMAMLHNPTIVFLDEPTIGLDVIAKESIREFIREMNRQGTTFILTTHDLGDVEALVRRVIVINHGQLVFDHPLDELRRLSGTKKHIAMTTEQPLPDLSAMEHVTVLNKVSPLHAELEIDTEKKPLNALIQQIHEYCTISDMTIMSPPIERIIKELYADGQTEPADDHLA